MGNTIQLDQEEQELLSNLCQENEIRARFDYTGRGMSYSKRCFGIVGGEDTLVQFLQDVAPQMETIDPIVWRRVSSDSMGMNTIYYWEGVTVVTKN